MHVGMILRYNLFENCHTGLYPFLNNSLFPNLQEYNWFHIYETLEMTFTVFDFYHLLLMMRFKERKYRKLCQRKSEIKFLKKC